MSRLPGLGPVRTPRLVPTRDHRVADKSENQRFPTDIQVVIDADTRLVIATSRPLPGGATTPGPGAVNGSPAGR